MPKARSIVCPPWPTSCVQQRVDVFVTEGNAAALAAKRATQSIPHRDGSVRATRSRAASWPAWRNLVTT